MKKLFLTFSTGLFLASLAFLAHSLTPNPVISPKPSVPYQLSPTPNMSQIFGEKNLALTQKQTALISKIKSEIPEGTTVGLAITDINTRSTFGLNESLVLPAASVNKVTTAAYLLNEIYKGKYSLDDNLGNFSIKDHLHYLLNVSSNESWDALGNLIGWQEITNFGKLLGMKKVDLTENVATAEDFNTLMLAILNNKVGDKNLTDLFLSEMQNTETEDRIPKGLPKKTLLYHKTGSINTSINDSAIVLIPNNPFILTILTKDHPGGRDGANLLIQKITSEVYRYFNPSDRNLNED